MEKKTAVYICSGCGIGDALDAEKLSKVATDEGSVPLCRIHGNLCSQEGVELIKNDIANEGANTLVIAACSHRVMYDVFNFESCIVDRVNIREQVAWCQKPGDEDTQLMAEDYLRMGLAKVDKMELPEPFKPEEEISSRNLGQFIDEAVGRLSERQKITFVLKHYEGYKIREIAEILDCKEGTVKKYLFDAVKNLRKQLEPLGAFQT